MICSGRGLISRLGPRGMSPWHQWNAKTLPPLDERCGSATEKFNGLVAMEGIKERNGVNANPEAVGDNIPLLANDGQSDAAFLSVSDHLCYLEDIPDRERRKWQLRRASAEMRCIDFCVG
jgi:hypothetical protein